VLKYVLPYGLQLAGAVSVKDSHIASKIGYIYIYVRKKRKKENGYLKCNQKAKSWHLAREMATFFPVKAPFSRGWFSNQSFGKQKFFFFLNEIHSASPSLTERKR